MKPPQERGWSILKWIKCIVLPLSNSRQIETKQVVKSKIKRRLLLWAKSHILSDIHVQEWTNKVTKILIQT